jgi:hypothetical protein
MTDKEALKLALEALEKVTKEMLACRDELAERGGRPTSNVFYQRLWDSSFDAYTNHAMPAAEAIKQSLAAPVQEPVAIDGNTSDGYHTFNELYEFRKAYNAALFNEWAAGGKCSVHKSWRHHDGELCFGGGWFIVVAVLPDGQISNHYEAKDWDLFAVPETERALFEFDGHTGADVVERLKTYTTPPAAKRPWVGLTDAEKQWIRITEWTVDELIEWVNTKLKEKNT